MDEIPECHLICVVPRSTEDYENLHRDRLSEIPSVTQMKMLLSLSTVKEFHGVFLGE